MLLTPWLQTVRSSRSKRLRGRVRRNPYGLLRGHAEVLEDRTLLAAASVVAAAKASLHGPDGVGKDGPLANVDFNLNVLYHEYQAYVSQGGTQGLFQPSHPLMRVIGDRVVVDAVAEDNIDDIYRSLLGVGMQIDATWGVMASGTLPLDAVDEAAAIPGLSFLKPAQYITSAGSVDSQGDVAMGSDLARTMNGVDGSGIVVGTLSDSFDNNVGTPLTTASDDVLSGDLPAGVAILDDSIPGNDEGRAMMQIVTDVAPGAQQAFHTAGGGQASFAQGIVDLANVAGADVIVDDVLYIDEPMFQDGVIAQAVDQVASQGVSYFSAAGNLNRQSYEGPFVDSGVPGFVGGTLHDFDPGPGVNAFQQVTIPVGTTFTIVFQWDQPFGSLGGAAAASDMDLCMTAGPSIVSPLVGIGVNRNIGNDAIESWSYTNNGAFGTTFFIEIEIFAGPAPQLMKYVFFTDGGTATIDDSPTNSSTAYGHANAAGAMAVGAAFYGDTPAFGQTPALLEPFSSVGGVPILFDTAGLPLPMPEVRNTPAFVAPDGVDTTFFTAGVDVEPNGFPNFFGTSAAAPHAAGVAALMLEAAGGPGTLTPTEIRTTLETTALDMAAPGFDFESGFGFIDALAAVTNSVPTNLPPVVNDQAFSIPDTSPNGTFVGTVVASDPNVGDTLTYAIIAGNNNNAFQIDSMTGDITVNNNVALETQPLFSLTVEVTDNGGLSDTATVSVMVTRTIGPSNAFGVFFAAIRELVVTVEASDDVVLTVSAMGNVLVNGVNPLTGPLLALDVASILVEGGEGSNLIDVSQVLTVDFPILASLRVRGRDGADILLASPFGGMYFGGHGDDAIFGASGADTIDGDDGEDTILGGDGDDCLMGEDGNDSIDGEGGNDVIDAGDGNDIASGGDGDDNLIGGNGLDTLAGDAGADTLNGGFNNDVLDGGDDDDRLFGGADEDQMNGGAGNDLLNGNAGLDTLDGGDGDDSLIGGVHDDSLDGGAGNDSIEGNDGADTINAGAGDDTVSGDADNDLINGDAGNDSLLGGTGDDFLNGGTDNDTLEGQAGADTLLGGSGADVLDGGVGNDLLESSGPLFDPLGDELLGGDGDDTLRGAQGNDSLSGQEGNDSLEGGAGNDNLEGNAGQDTLLGGDGNDLLDGGRGADSVLGELGNDTIAWESFDGDDRVDGGFGFDELEARTLAHNDRITVSAVGDGRFSLHHRIASDPIGNTVRGGMIEILSIDSNGGADRITVEDLTGVTWLQQVSIDAGRGSDLVDASAQANPAVMVSVDGGTGADTVIGGAGDDAIDGGQGNDSLVGGKGADTLNGSDGVDKLFGSGGNDVLIGGAGRDFLRGEDGDDTLAGGPQNDDLFGGEGNDFLLGETGDDSLLGEGGNDVADGGDGADTVDGGAGNDSLLGSAGDDSLRGRDGEDTLLGGADNDTLAGGRDDDLLLGGDGTIVLLVDGNDFLNGNAGNDTLDGERGDDTVLGGAGADEMDGGFGNDQHNGNAGNDSMRGGQGNDLMRGGAGHDTLNGGHGEDKLFGQSGNDGLSGHDGHDRLNGGDGADTLHGGDGDDTLRGGAGLDLLIGHDGEDNLNGQGGDPDTLVGQDAFDILDDNNGLDVKDNNFVFFADWIDDA